MNRAEKRGNENWNHQKVYEKGRFVSHISEGKCW